MRERAKTKVSTEPPSSRVDSPAETVAETTPQRRRRVRAAGYYYQDLVAALMLARTLVDGYRQVRIEIAEHNEVFDDHAVTLGQQQRLVQVKHSDTESTLTWSDLATASGRIPIDRLMASASALLSEDPVGFRVFASWRPPLDADRAGFLLNADAVRIDQGLPTSLWRLDHDAIWPPDGPPRWKLLEGSSRDQFVAFCERFVLELDGPQMSANLSEPGPLEAHVVDVVHHELQVGRPPNAGRDPVDVADALLITAMSARSRLGRTFLPEDIVREARLVVDDGALAAAFPLETARVVRTSLMDQIAAEAATDGVVVVQGSPGAGKSWALESAVPELERQGHIVARHYCFLEPGDPSAQTRVATNTMCAVLIGELRRNERFEDTHIALARDPIQLEAFLERAVEQLDPPVASDGNAGPGESPTAARIVLIVDGIDHVARADPITGPRDVDQFVLTLAELNLPPRVTLIVGSQPGPFLDPLMSKAHVIQAPSFDEPLVAEQLERLGLVRALNERGMTEPKSIVPFLRTFFERSDGNPLYVRYLGLEALDALSSGIAVPDILRTEPVLVAGDLNAYYDRLLGADAGVVAEQLAVLDFPVTAGEVAEVLPSLGRARIDDALRRIRPVLVEVPRLGVRIYHESVRRFVIERRLQAEGSLAALVEPVVVWLTKRGFYADDRAFRWLLPTLRRADRAAECVRMLGPGFIERRIAELHPGAAVAANIRSAAYAARDTGDLVGSAAISELRTAATTAYEDRVEDVEDYARTVVTLRGPDALARRLLYEGRPVRPRAIGLRMCALVDAAGGLAPWSEYLSLPDIESSDVNDVRQQDRLDAARGSLRLSTSADAIEMIAEWTTGPEDVPQRYSQGLAALVREIHGTDALRAVVAREGTSQGVRRSFLIELARGQFDAGDLAGAATTGAAAIADGAHEMDLVDLLNAGAPPEQLATIAPQPVDLVPDVLAGRAQPNAQAVRRFVASVLVHAAAGSALAPVRSLLAGAGWYRRWLRYVVDLGRVRQGQFSIVSAFEELAADTRPFVGEPRAADLYGIALTVRDTIRRGLLIATVNQRRQLAPHLVRVATGTTVVLENTPMGALPLGALLEVLEEFPDRELVALVAQAASVEGGEVYGTHAEHALTMARLWNSVGEVEKAEDEWRRACRFLAAYGYHKDYTIFTLLDGIEAIGEKDRAKARERALRVRRLTELAATHTDGDETRHAPRLWLRTLLRIDHVLAARTLARTLIRNARVPNEANDDLIAAVLTAMRATAPPLVRHLLWRCIPARDRVTERLATLSDLLEVDRARGERAFSEVAADVEGDAEKDDAASSDLLRQFALNHGLPDPGIALTPSDPRRQASASEPPPERPAPREDGPFLPADATPATLMLALRRTSFDRWNAPISQKVLARELVEHLRRLATEGGEDLIVTILEDFARSRPFFDARVLFQEVSEALRADYPRAAAEGYVLAWCASRRDWEVFGGPQDFDLLDRAVALDRDRAFARIAAESADVIDRYEFGLGLSRRLVEVLAHLGRINEACAAWDAAYAVIEYRLPDLGIGEDIFLLPDDSDNPEEVGAIGQLCAALLTHPVFARRAAALSALVELASRHREIVTAALNTAIGSDTVLTDQMLALQTGLMTNVLPTDTVAVRALAESTPFNVAALALRVLERAGENAPGDRSYMWTATDVTGAEVAEALRFDYDERAERLSAWWEGLPSLAADRYWHERLSDNRHERIRRRQAEEQRSLVAPWVPPLELHDWYRELFEAAIGEALWGLRAHCSALGRWGSSYEERVLRVVLPDVATSSARARSRILRPPGPLPEQVVDGRSVPTLEMEGTFTGWLRAAWMETHVTAAEMPHDSGTETVARGGLVRRGRAVTEPVRLSTRVFRWHERDSDNEADITEPHLVRLEQQMDCTAWDPVLAPTVPVREHLGLRPAPVHLPLDLLDSDGRTAIALRYWRMRPYGYEYGPPTPLLRGAALFIRADVWARVSNELGAFEMVVMKTRTTLP